MNRTTTVVFLALLSASLAAAESTAEASSIQVPIRVEQDCFATAVIESADGTRVCNLVSEMPVKAGTQNFTWDLYDVGDQADEHSPYVRQRVKPGTYRVRGLTFDQITPKYEFSVYSPGTPPWRTEDGTGSWMSDHCPPLDVVWLPKGSHLGSQPQLMMCAQVGESGTAVMWIDEGGRKLGGRNWGWYGASALARDEGPQADPAVVAYGIADGLYAFTVEGKRELIVDLPMPVKPFPDISDWKFLDLAVHNGLAVVANTDNRDNVDTTTGNLAVFDLKTRKLLANHLTAPSRGVCFGPDGRLYALLGGELHRFTVDPASGRLSEDTKLVAGLDEPRRVRLLGGRLHIGVWGKKHQIEVYDLKGQRLRSIGRPGGAQIGAYDEQRMERPEGMTVDGNGNLWVMEGTMVPKRISRWDAQTGAFRSAIYGGPLYGGGGVLDPADKSVFYYPHQLIENAGLRFQLDWKTGASRLDSIYWRSPLRSREASQTMHGPIDATCPKSPPQVLQPGLDVPLRSLEVPAFAYRVGSHRYLAYTGTARGGPAPAWGALFLADADIARPVALVGDLQRLLAQAERAPELLAACEKAGLPLVQLWSDLDFNGRIDPDELQFLHEPEGGCKVQGVYFEPDLALTLLNLRGGRLPPPQINAKGVPRWDVARIAQVCEQVSDRFFHGCAGVPLVGKDWVVLASHGWEHFTNPHGYRRGGALGWSYRFYGVNFVNQFPGQLVMGPLALGPVLRPPRGEAAEIWCTNGEKGAFYLMTTDGLFLRTFGAHMKTRPLWRMPKAERGMPIEGVSFEDEGFGCSLQQCEDGNVYMVAGKDQTSILRIDGLETVKRRDWGTITITQRMLDGLPERLEEWPPTQMRKELDVLIGGEAPVVDGKLDDWAALPPTAWAQLDARVSAAVRVVGDRLYAAFRTNDPKLLENAAQDPRFAFKGGGALDLFLSVGPDNELRDQLNAGDCRLLVTRLKGKPAAILYRPVAPTEGPEEKVQWVDSSGIIGKDLMWIRLKPAADESCIFQSPIGKEVFAAVTDISAQLQLAQVGGDYELSIPFRTIIPMDFDDWGHQPWREQFRFVVGDLGIIRGNGTQNIQRLCWNNIATEMVSDIPSEVRMKPQLWGQFNLIPAGNVHLKAPAPREAPKDLKPGLRWDYWELPVSQDPVPGNEAAVWNFLAGAPTAAGEIDRLGLAPAKRADHVGLRFRGWLTVPMDGWYAFDVWGNSAVRLILGGTTIASVDWWSQSDRRYHRVQLKAGRYPVEVDWYKGGRTSSELVCDWSGPGFSKQPLQAELLAHAPGDSP